MELMTRVRRINATRTGRSGFSLIELLVVCAIIAALSAITMSVYLGHSKGPNGKAASPIDRAKDTVCMSNLSQIRQGLMIAEQNLEDSDHKYPASLDELKFPKEVLSCPDGHVAYVYDPTTGEVHCPYPGHEKY